MSEISRQARDNRKSFWVSSWGIIILICVFLILSGLVAFGITVWQYKEKIEAGEMITEFENTNAEFANTNEIDPGRIYPGRDNNPFLGPEDSPVEVIFFEDFECPICKQLFPVKKAIIDEYDDRVVFVFRHFPLESIHDNAMNAALAAECANEQGGFWPMHDKLFQNQENLSETDLKIYAQQIGLNDTQFEVCFDTRKYDEEIQKDLKEGVLHQVGGTPTFFVNGEKFEGVPTEEYFRQLLDFYLQK
ncbi:DsbA family protein [Patescibacteria group bacterium]|nr:DsbA family protein [Patescibacteria group bacterium]MBU1673087.1 DsbA family protein [Patescibacteria group bacterium]MBU1963693.1 DsbA family protein [Patescibacteria group bacterium]